MSLKPQASNPNLEFDPSIPLWKRELILRKRARGQGTPSCLDGDSKTSRGNDTSKLLKPPPTPLFGGLGSPYQSKFSYHTVYSTRKDGKDEEFSNSETSLVRGETALGKASVRGSYSSPQICSIQGCSRLERHCESSVGVKSERYRDVNQSTGGSRNLASCDHSYVITCQRPVTSDLHEPHGKGVHKNMKMSPVINANETEGSYMEYINARGAKLSSRAHNDPGSSLSHSVDVGKRKGKFTHSGIDSRAQFRKQSPVYSNGGLLVTNGVGGRHCVGLANGLHNGVDDSDSGSEYEYGPGIVNKLRSKFINLTIRQQKELRRPALRKVASLENLIDNEAEECFEKGYANRANLTEFGMMSDSSRQEGGRVWKAKSMEALSTAFDGRGTVITEPLKSVSDLTANFDTRIKKSLLEDLPKVIESHNVAKNVVIIEATNAHTRLTAEGVRNALAEPKTRTCGSASENEEELPRPDMVKQIKKIYEPNSPKRHIKKGSVCVMKNNYKNTLLRQVNVPKNSRPSVENLVPIRPPCDRSDNNSSSVRSRPGGVADIQPYETKLNDKPPISGVKPDLPPKSGALLVKVPSQPPVDKISSSQHSVSHADSSGRDGVVLQKLEMSDFPANFAGSNDSPDKIRSCGNDVSKPKIIPRNSSVRAPREIMGDIDLSSPSEILNKPPDSSVQLFPSVSAPKQIGVIKPMSKLDEKYSKDPEGAADIKPHSVVPDIKSNSGGMKKATPLNSTPEVKSNVPKPIDSASKVSNKDRGKSQQNNTSLVFNFAKDSKKEIPNYIEYDGLDLSNRKKKAFLLDGKIPGQESSDAGDDDEPLDSLDSVSCDIVVEGGYVIINGKSSLHRGTRKRLNISFAEKHILHEYPSEQSVYEEYLVVEGELDNTAVSDDSLEHSANDYKFPTVGNSSGPAVTWKPKSDASSGACAGIVTNYMELDGTKFEIVSSAIPFQEMLDNNMFSNSKKDPVFV